MKRRTLGIMAGIIVIMAIVPFYQQIWDGMISAKDTVTGWWGRNVDRDRNASPRIQEVNEAVSVSQTAASGGGGAPSGVGQGNRARNVVERAGKREKLP